MTASATQSPHVTINGVLYWIQDIACGKHFVHRENPNRRPWIDPWWTLIGGPFDTRLEARDFLDKAPR